VPKYPLNVGFLIGIPCFPCNSTWETKKLLLGNSESEPDVKQVSFVITKVIIPSLLTKHSQNITSLKIRQVYRSDRR